MKQKQEKIEKKCRVSLTAQEIGVLSNVLHHLTDYMAMDDRPDHGMAMLKLYREVQPDLKYMMYRLTGKMMRLSRRIVSEGEKTYVSR